MLWRAARDCPVYAQLLRDTLAVHHCTLATPRCLILYFDEISPSTDLKGASDHPDAPPAIGALTGGDQASGGAKPGAIPPTAGDGVASSPASGASR